MKFIAKKIKQYRESLNYSQEFVAHKLSISQPAYAKLEKGTTRMDLERLLQISSILNIGFEELLESNKTKNHIGSDYEFLENLYRDNKKNTQKLLVQLENENNRLLKENTRLQKLLQKRGGF